MRNSYRASRKAITRRAVTIFFEWAERQGYSIYDIARSLKLHYITVYRIQKGQYVKRAAENFAIRAVAAYGPEVEKIFSPVLTVTNGNHADTSEA